jgi:hypothetical protein
MLTSIQGIYRKGKIEFAEEPNNVRDETPVIVTFLQSVPIDLRERGFDEQQAAELRSRLAMFANDWDIPEMDIYDRYDSVKANP